MHRVSLEVQQHLFSIRFISFFPLVVIVLRVLHLYLYTYNPLQFNNFPHVFMVLPHMIEKAVFHGEALQMQDVSNHNNILVIQPKRYFKNSSSLTRENPVIATKKHRDIVGLGKLMMFELDCDFLAVWAGFTCCNLYTSEWLKHWMFSSFPFC